jgi:hypothetical protein
MPLLPNATKAIVTLEKLRDYSLDPNHEKGKHKARVFASALGFTQQDARRLREMILQAILINEVAEGKSDVHGARYTVDFKTQRLTRDCYNSYCLDY